MHAPFALWKKEEEEAKGKAKREKQVERKKVGHLHKRTFNSPLRLALPRTCFSRFHPASALFIERFRLFTATRPVAHLYPYLLMGDLPIGPLVATWRISFHGGPGHPSVNTKGKCFDS